jgi:hypothetical protein
MEKYSDEELFELWKNADKDDKNVGLIGYELVKRGYLLDEDEYNALDYYMQESKLYDSGLFIMQDEYGRDYFVDEDNNENLTLKEGLGIVYESIVDDYVKEMPSTIKNGLKKVFKRVLDIDLEV